MYPRNLVVDLMNRTILNLEYIEKNSNQNGPYEVTQLINSFLGALAHPWEKWKDDLKNISLKKAKEMGWPEVDNKLKSDSNPRDLEGLIRYLRNGIAHGNIEFTPNENNIIYKIRIWNEYPMKHHKRTWETVLEITTLRKLLYCFNELAKELPK